MKKTITLLLCILTVLSLNAQVELIRNGDFTLGTTPSESIKDIANWNMDIATPASGWWDSHAGLTSTDPSLYQVIETISSDSVLYTLSFNVNNVWETEKVVAIASVTDADSSIRTMIDSVQLTAPLNISTDLEFKFGFSEDSPYSGKKLIVEFDLIPIGTDTAWTNLDNVSMKKIIAGINSAPVAITGPPQTVKGGDMVTLDGSGSTDFEGSDLTYKWVSVYPGIFLSDKNAVNPTFTAPDVTELTTFQFTLVVNDGELNSELVITNVTVSPAGELIRNGGFEVYNDGSNTASTSLKDVASWNIDQVTLNGGRWGNVGLKQITLSSKDPAFYQVIKTIGTVEATYTLTFSARSSWNSEAIKSIFSVSDADSSLRTEIDSKESSFGIDVPGGINTSTMKAFSHVFVIPANSEYAGKTLILEFDNIPYEDGTDNGWIEMDNVSLIESTSSAVITKTNLNLSIYPNPASKLVNINSVSNITKVNIYSTSGVLEKSQMNSNVRQVELSGLSKGLHFISLTSDTRVITLKLEIK